MSELTTHVGIDAHKAELHVAMLAPDAAPQNRWAPSRTHNRPRAISSRPTPKPTGPDSPGWGFDSRPPALYRVNMPRPRHPKKDVEDALAAAEGEG